MLWGHKSPGGGFLYRIYRRAVCASLRFSASLIRSTFDLVKILDGILGGFFIESIGERVALSFDFALRKFEVHLTLLKSL